MSDFLSSPMWNGIAAIVAIIGLLLTVPSLRSTFFPRVRAFLSSPMWSGIVAIIAIIGLLTNPLVHSALFPEQKSPSVPQVHVSPTSSTGVDTTPTHLPVITPAPTHIIMVEPTSLPTVISSPSSVVNTLQKTMQQFCASIYNGDENTAFSILTTEAQQSNYQGNVQKFWDDFQEYSGNICKVVLCNVTSCDIAFSSPIHKSCRDNFTLVNLGHYSWRITGWSSPDNSCN